MTPPISRSELWISRGRRWAPLVILGLLAASMLFPRGLRAQELPPNDPEEGNFTVGFYADAEGSVSAIELGKDDTSFDLYIGLTGDVAQVFASAVFRIELPDYLEAGSAIFWQPIEGLKETERFFDDGGQVVFASCAAQPTPDAPLILGRFTVDVDPRFREAELKPEEHRSHGVGVKVCRPDKTYGPKTAEGVGVTVTRTTSFWDKVTAWFE